MAAFDVAAVMPSYLSMRSVAYTRTLRQHCVASSVTSNVSMTDGSAVAWQACVNMAYVNVVTTVTLKRICNGGRA